MSDSYSFAGFPYAGMLSRRGHRAAFSADADGFVRTEGGAVLVLRRLTDAVAEAASGAYRRLPHTAYPAARVEEAFHLLQHSRHTGKAVVTFDPLDGPVPVEPAPGTLRPDGEGTYPITGGLSGPGAATARLPADRGARPTWPPDAPWPTSPAWSTSGWT